jgi:hypothetical protein
MTEAAAESTDILMLFIRAAGLKSPEKGNLLNAADPFFEVLNEHEELVARSQILYSDLNPNWPPLRLDMHALCASDEGRAVDIVFYDFDKDQDHREMARIETCVADLKKAAKAFRAQRDISNILDRKESFTLETDDGTIRVFVYDVLHMQGTPSKGTLVKKKSASTNESTSTVTTESSSVGASEDGDHRAKSPTNAGSVTSNDSTIMMANGMAPPRAKTPLPTKAQSLVKGMLGMQLDDIPETNAGETPPASPARLVTLPGSGRVKKARVLGGGNLGDDGSVMSEIPQEAPETPDAKRTNRDAVLAAESPDSSKAPTAFEALVDDPLHIEAEQRGSELGRSESAEDLPLEKRHKPTSRSLFDDHDSVSSGIVSETDARLMEDDEESDDGMAVDPSSLELVATAPNKVRNKVGAWMRRNKPAQSNIDENKQRQGFDKPKKEYLSPSRRKPTNEQE